MAITLDDLFQVPFSARTLEQKMAILHFGRPTPLIGNANYGSKSVGIVENNLFYEKYHWLAGCKRRRAFVCWTCLLFMEKQHLWNAEGWSNLRALKQNVATHDQSSVHIEAMLKYQLFIHVNVLSESDLVAQKGLDETVKHNREIMKQVIGAVCYVISEKSPPLKRKIQQNQIEIQDCVDVLSFLENFEKYAVSIDVINLLKASPVILNDVVSAIASVVKDDIKRETQTSTYVSVILTEHSEIDSQSLISTVLRYLKKGKVCERFIGFTNISQYKSGRNIYDFISSIIHEYSIEEKFIAYSIDGAVLASSYHMNQLEKELRDDYPFSYLVPCYFHNLERIVEQSVMHLKECRQFLKNLKSVKEFFINDQKAYCKLYEMIGGDMTQHFHEEWSDFKFLKLLSKHRKRFLAFFEKIILDSYGWNPLDLPKALAFQHNLNQFGIVFLMIAFCKILKCTSILGNALTSRFEAAFGRKLQIEVIQALEVEKQDNSFEDAWVSAVSELLHSGQDSKPPSLKPVMEENEKLLYKEFYFKIIDAVIQEIKHRFGSFEELLFFHILDCQKHGKFVNAEEPIKSLLAVHAPVFHETWVKNEVMVLSSNNDIFNGKSLYELMDFFIAVDLKLTFRNLFKIAELTLTMPCKPPSLNSGVSKLHKINEWAFISDSKVASNDLEILCIEKDLLEESKAASDFMDKVLQSFQQMNKTILV